jgi:REP element-mobilizing transposase RayT
VSHRVRAAFAPRFPQHVTWRVAAGVPSLRRGATAALIRRAVSAARRATFAVVEFNILTNHIHMLVEADGAEALSRGMRSLGVRLARRINAHLARSGPVFKRYHARCLCTPREVRNALRYVLLNARHHAAEQGRRLARDWIDPYSTAPWFDGFATPDCRSTAPPPPPWLAYLRSLPRPTAPPRTWLLAIGWRRHGLLVTDDAPG